MPPESIALEELEGSKGNSFAETHDLIVPLSDYPNNAPSLEAFLLPEDSPNGSVTASVVPPSHRWPILSRPNGCNLVDEIAKELRSFRGLVTLHTIFWELLGYERIGKPLPRRAFSVRVWRAIREATFLGQHEGIYVLTVRLEDGRFTHVWRNAVLSQARGWFATAIILFSDFGWSRAVLGWTGESDASLRKSLRLWPLTKADRIPLAEKLASLRASDDVDSPRGTLDLSESIRQLGEHREIKAFAHDFQEPPVDPDRLYDLVFKQCPPMKQQETEGLIHALAGLRPEERAGTRKEEYLKLRDRLICGHIRLCARVIKHFKLFRQCQSLTWADLMQEGIFGLAQAIDRFDVNRGTKFSTYAFPWIRQAINRAIENKDRLIRIPTHCLREKDRLREYEWWRLTKILSLSSKDRGVAHELADVRYDSPASRLNQHELEHTLGKRIEESLRILNGRRREILERRFGLGGRKPQTLQKIADHFGLTRERVRQLENKALEKLRKSGKLEQFQEIFYEESHS